MKNLIVIYSTLVVLLATLSSGEDIVSVHAYANKHDARVLNLNSETNTVLDLVSQYCNQEKIDSFNPETVKVVPMIIGGFYKPYELSKTIKEAGLTNNQHVKIVLS